MSAAIARGTHSFVGLIGLLAIASMLVDDGRAQPPTPGLRKVGNEVGTDPDVLSARCGPVPQRGHRLGVAGPGGKDAVPRLVRLDEARVLERAGRAPPGARRPSR